MSQQNDNRNYRRQMYKSLPTQSSSAFQRRFDPAEITQILFSMIIPWDLVPPDIRFELIKLLNPPSPLSGNDWRMLAYELGFTAADINFFESEKDNNTSVLFRYYDEKPGASFNDVYRFLAKMQRHDCIDVLNNAFDRIRQAYIQAQSAQRLHAAGIPGPLVTGAHNRRPYHSCPCTHGGHLTSLYGSHTYCPCGNGFTICRCVGNNHLHSHPPDHSVLPHPYQLEISQPACAPVQDSPSPTYSVHKNVPKKPQTQVIDSGYAQEERNSTDIHSSPVGSYLSHQQPAHRHNLGSRVECLNVNVTGDNMNTRGDTNRQKVNRQHSEECNVLPDFHTDSRFQNKCNCNRIGRNQVATCVAADHFGGNIEAAGYSGLANSDNRLNGCAVGMAHFGRSLSDSKVKRNFPQGDKDRPTGMISCPSNIGQSLAGDHMKAKHDQPTEVSTDSRRFKMSLSMPADMKPKPFRKAHPQSKVFVTCSLDNDLHIREVRSLCQFLLHNGFPCYVDMRNDGDSDTGSNSRNSYTQSIAKADFILVCISNKYLEDIAPDRSDCPSSLTNNHLHTREVYELLSSKYLDNIHSNNNDIAQTPKVIPLLFDSMTENQIPRWMRRGHTYKWPDDYMDLVKLLQHQKRRDDKVV